MGITGNFYKLMLLLHIACAILGFGAMAFNGFYLARARRVGNGAQSRAALEVNNEVSRIAEILVYATFVFGILVVATSKSAWKMSNGWIGTAMGLYVVDIALLHGFIRRVQRRYGELAAQVSGQLTRPASGGRPPQVGEMEQLEQRLQLGWAAFDIIFLVILFFMVF